MPDGAPGSAIPPQLAAMAGGGGAPAPGAPPPAPGGGMPGGMNPLAMLAQRGQGGAPPQMMNMLIFLAGMGFPEFTKSMNTMKPKEPKHPGTGLPADAARAPQQAIPPQLIAQMVARQAGAGGPPPGAPPMLPGRTPV